MPPSGDLNSVAGTACAGLAEGAREGEASMRAPGSDRGTLAIRVSPRQAEWSGAGVEHRASTPYSAGDSAPSAALAAGGPARARPFASARSAIAAAVDLPSVIESAASIDLSARPLGELERSGAGRTDDRGHTTVTEWSPLGYSRPARMRDRGLGAVGSNRALGEGSGARNGRPAGCQGHHAERRNGAGRESRPVRH